jgi:hypothetical protein
VSGIITKPPTHLLAEDIMAACARHAMGTASDGGMSFRICQDALAQVYVSLLIQAPKLAHEPALQAFMDFVRRNLDSGIDIGGAPKLIS